MKRDEDSFDKLVRLIKNPKEFYKKNKDKKEDLITFMGFVSRISILVTALVLAFQSIPLMFFGFLLIIFLFIRPFMRITLALGSFFLGLFILWILKYDNEEKTDKIVAFAQPAVLLSPIPLIGELLSSIIWVLLATIGVSQQYKQGIGKSFFIVVLPYLIICSILFLLIAIIPLL